MKTRSFFVIACCIALVGGNAYAEETPAGPFGTLTMEIKDATPFRYTFTAQDALWLARMITGEAGGKDNAENRAVAWTMFNRFGYWLHDNFRQFGDFIRRYSTPLQNPLNSWGAAKRHMNDKSFVKNGEFYAAPHNDVPKGQLKQFLDLQAKTWSQLPEG